MFHDIEIVSQDGPLSTFAQLTDPPVGYTVGRAARILGMTRQGITRAIERDALHATRLYLVNGDKRTLISTEVDRESVHSLAAIKTERDRAPRGYRDDQHPLPF